MHSCQLQCTAPTLVPMFVHCCCTARSSSDPVVADLCLPEVWRV
jgi:hypothetical protein